MQPPWSHRLRDVPAILAAIALLVSMALAWRWLYARPSDAPTAVTAQITGFYGYTSRAYLQNFVIASVRLPSGYVARVPWPQDGRASHCRKGDVVHLTQYGGRLRVAGEGCPRRPPTT